MKVIPLKTARWSPGAPALTEILDTALSAMPEAGVLAVTSKLAAICEGRTIPISPAVDKTELVKRESDYYLPKHLADSDFTFTITKGTLIPMAGIDESNGDGHYVLWPANPQETANRVRSYLKRRFDLKKVGVILTDSTVRPLHYGTEGVAIAYSGFEPSNNYQDTPDLFGRKLKVSVSNVADALAAAAVAVMGEGNEQTPFALIENVPFVSFQNHDPTSQELQAFFISHLEDDLFKPFLKNAPWQKGGDTQV